MPWFTSRNGETGELYARQLVDAQKSDPPRQYLMGVDLAQQRDYTAIVVCEIEPGREPRYLVRHLERARGISYPQVVQRVATLMQTPPLLGHTRLVVDSTGVGMAVCDMMRAANLPATPVVITGGERPNTEGRPWSVPKKDLATVVAILLQQDRLRISGQIPLSATLQRELESFTVKPTATGTMFGAWRESDHDDLVLAAALALWAHEAAAKVYFY